MYEAAYTVSALKKSNVHDDFGFLTENSRLLKSIYFLNEKICRNIWQNKNFAIPGLGDSTFKVNKTLTHCETTYVEEHSQSFMAKKEPSALCMQNL